MTTSVDCGEAWKILVDYLRLTETLLMITWLIDNRNSIQNGYSTDVESAPWKTSWRWLVANKHGKRRWIRGGATVFLFYSFDETVYAWLESWIFSWLTGNQTVSPNHSPIHHVRPHLRERENQIVQHWSWQGTSFSYSPIRNRSKRLGDSVSLLLSLTADLTTVTRKEPDALTTNLSKTETDISNINN